MDERLTWLNGGLGQGGSPGHPQGVWFDSYGKLFQNESWGTIEHWGFPSLFMNRDTIYCLYDSDLPERLRRLAPAHGSTDPTEGNITSWRNKLAAAYEQKGEIWYREDSDRPDRIDTSAFSASGEASGPPS